MSITAKHLIFIGRVQGIGFRFTALNTANRCNLTGLVRNLPDGSVEMIAQGIAEDIDNCVRDIQESFTGCINQTKVEELPPNPEYKNFKITF